MVCATERHPQPVRVHAHRFVILSVRIERVTWWVFKAGTSITTSSSGPTPTGFSTAFFAGGSSMSIIRAADVTPNTAPYQLYFLLNSLIGASVSR